MTNNRNSLGVAASIVTQSLFAKFQIITSSNQDLEEFKDDNHFLICPIKMTKKSGQPLIGVLLEPSGVELVAEYYSEKYHANITLESSYNFPYLNFLLNDCIGVKTNDRRAWIIGVGQEHSTPIIYIQENKEAVFLYVNSLGVNDDVVKKLIRMIGLPVYSVEDVRQADGMSCYTDALLFARDTTAKDKNGQYRIANLLSKLKSRAVEVNHLHYKVKLPDELLKTAQISQFIDEHTENSDRKIHKNETLSQFRLRYEQQHVVVGDKSEKLNMADYLRQKGLKLANIIEIQFYLRQLKIILKDQWSSAVRDEYIKHAKNLFNAQGDVCFKRAGLYNFTKIFISLRKERKEEMSVRVLEKPVSLRCSDRSK